MTLDPNITPESEAPLLETVDPDDPPLEESERPDEAELEGIPDNQ